MNSKLNPFKNFTKMIELYLSKVTETSESEQAGKLYARVSYKQTLNVQDMAHHMSEHNTMFSEGSITGILIDFVKCVREQVLMGNTVKIDNLAIFKATVEANGLDVLYDADTDKVASATIGTLAEGAKTGPAVKVIKLLAQSTGDFTRDELKKDVKLSWTDKTKAEIAAAKGDQNGGASSGSGTEGGGTGTNTGGNGGSQQGGNSQQGGSQNGGQSQQNGFALTISTSGSGSSTVTLNGSAVSSGASLNEDDEVEISITPAEGQVPTASVNGSEIELTENDGVYTGSFAMPGQASTLVINTGTTSGGDNHNPIDTGN